MKYTICRVDTYLADAKNNRILFDSRGEAEKFKIDNNLDASVLGYMNESKMTEVDGYSAWCLFKEGMDVYTKIFGVDWSPCSKHNFDFDDFTRGYFKFYVEIN